MCAYLVYTTELKIPKLLNGSKTLHKEIVAWFRLHLASHELGHTHADSIMCYKIIFGHVAVNAYEFFLS